MLSEQCGKKEIYHDSFKFLSSFSTGGLRGTAFVHSPLLKSKGRVSMDLMHLSDWVPTLYGCGGGNVSDLIGLDGVDMWPTLSQGLASPRKELVHNIDPVGWAAALRYQNWKLVVNASTWRVRFVCFFFFWGGGGRRDSFKARELG